MVKKMKRQIRKGVFETNSSSTHSLVICLKSDFDRWNNGEVLLFTGSEWLYPDDNAPQKNHFYTKEQAIEFEKSSKYPPADDMDWDSEEAEEYLRDNEWYTCENYDDEYSEWFDDTFTTPSGEEIIAFGQYGYCG